MAAQKSRDPRTDAGALLGEHLRVARVAAKFSNQDQLSSVMKIDRTVITKIETGERLPSAANFNSWLDICGVTGREREILTSLWVFAQHKEEPSRAANIPWYESEAKAHTLRYWGPLLVPGIIQAEGYARTLYAAWGFDEAKIEELLAERMARHSVLDREDPPDVSVVLWEPVLHNLIGTPEDMREQIAYFLEISGRPSVNLHVYKAGTANAGLGGSINLAAAEDMPEVLASDGFPEDNVTTSTALVRRASARFNRLRGDALNRADSRELLSKALETWNKKIAGASLATAARPEPSTA